MFLKKKTHFFAEFYLPGKLLYDEGRYMYLYMYP